MAQGKVNDYSAAEAATVAPRSDALTARRPLRVYVNPRWVDVARHLAPRPHPQHNFVAPIVSQLARHTDRSDWVAAAADAIQLAEAPEQADVIALPELYYLVGERDAREAAELANRSGALLLLFGHTDHYVEPQALADRSLLFHSDLRRSKLKPFHRVHPSFVQDHCGPGEWFPHPYDSHPAVFWRGTGTLAGFSPLKRAALRLTDNWRALRSRAVAELAASPNVTLHSTFTAGWWGMSEEEQLRARRRFVQEALENPYALVVRGSGNYSVRLYDVMALGRIPVIVDSDVALPWPELIDWERISLVVPPDDLPNIGARLSEFHAAFTPDRFAAVQEEIRRIWREHLSENGFYRTVSAYALSLLDSEVPSGAHSPSTLRLTAHRARLRAHERVRSALLR
jgi:Exostosin family